ncbi:MAG: B-box zinc finger protein [Lentisphaeria bacterium]|nr:B-box zinc finger protein [Lentisphaeria bacterium]
MAKISDSYCLNHPDTPAAARCATCGKHVCEKCTVVKDGVSYCSDACAEAAASSTGRVNSAIEAGRKNASKARLRAIVILIIIIAAAAGTWYYYTNNKDKIDSAVSEAKKNVQKSMDAGKKKIQDGVPGDAKYKRDRENLAK